MKKLIRIVGSYFLQFILAVIAYLSWSESYSFGNRIQQGMLQSRLQRGDRSYSATDVTAGFDGGALAMGLICCVCIIMIVWIEIKKNPKP